MNDAERLRLYEAAKPKAEEAGPSPVLRSVAPPKTGDQLRDEAVERVDLAASEEWKAAAWDAVKSVSGRLAYFTTDDVWEALRESAVSTHENRAMGAVMTRARKAGLIFPTDEWRKSNRPECHSNPKRVWRRTLA